VCCFDATIAKKKMASNFKFMLKFKTFEQGDIIFVPHLLQ
jgi:hypothetical protein